MKSTLRFILSLVVVAGLLVFVFAAFQARQGVARLEHGIERETALLAESLQTSTELFLRGGRIDELQIFVDRLGNREHLAGLAIYASDGQPVAMTAGLPERMRSLIPALRDMTKEAMATDHGQGSFQIDGQPRWYLRSLPIRAHEKVIGALVLAYDAGYSQADWGRLWHQDFLRLLLYVLLICFAALIIVQWSFIRPLSKMVDWMKRLRTGELVDDLVLPKEDLFIPLSREVTRMARSLIAARAAAEEEAKLRHSGESRWTPDRLREHVRHALKGRSLLVVSNREPYLHARQGRTITCVVPPGGLVTAMESVLRACGGTWIAHGAGDADRETADAYGRLRVPPDAPHYTLKRVWLTTEEENGYYYGFANEGLWPLCHIAHTRPIFRAEDWEQYARVNAKFADAILEELHETEQPCLLIQDYHFALLPRLIKERRPDAKLALFWHIPWPNPEAFGICPWARELLHGMLGADLIGFHTQFHCNNFLDTVDRMLESRVDWEQFTVERADHATWVKPFPISIAGPDIPEGHSLTPAEHPSALKTAMLSALGLRVRWVGLGVDRLDYTKGIPERFLAIERFFDTYPAYRGEFTFIELGAPSRSLIARYQQLETELEAEVERINRRFQTRHWKPLLFLKKQHRHEEIVPWYRAADVCLVTSLHDGMNLVSKEFVAARDDHRGVLILSQFTGASRELRDALIVNPYDIDQVTEAIHYALTMEPDEQQARMSRMRETLQEHNIYRWAANLVNELTQLRSATPRAPSSVQAESG